MDHCTNGIGIISQLFSEPVSDTKSAGWHIFNQSVQRTEVICPEPRRAIRVPCNIDSLNRFCYLRPKSSLNVDNSLEILGMILCQDDTDVDSDTSSQKSFYCGSPPVRSSNPIIHDAEFAKQSLPPHSPLGISHGGGGRPSPRVDRGASTCGSSFTGKPKVRIEGFSSGNSEPQYAVHGLA